MAAGYLNAAIHIQDRFRIIEHWRGAKTYAQHINAAIGKAAHHLGLQ